MAFSPKVVFVSPWVEKLAPPLKVTSLKFASWVNWTPLKVAVPPKVVFVSPWVEKLAFPLKVTSLKFAPWVNLTPLKAASLIKVDSLKSA